MQDNSQEDIMAARKEAHKKRYHLMTDDHRAKIANSNILNALVEHALGKREMSATQVQVGIALLKKVMPDLQAMQISGDPENPVNVVTTIRLIAQHGSRDQAPA